MERILDLARKAAAEAEVYVAESMETPVTFEANRLKTLETKQTVSVSLRIIKDGKIGFASSTRLDDPQALVDMAMETAEFGATARFTFPSDNRYPEIAGFDPDMDKLTVEDMVQFGESLISTIRSDTPELVCEAEIAKGVASVQIMNSKGGYSNYRKSFCYVAIEGTLIRDTDMLFVGEMESSCHPLREYPPLADSVIRQLELAKRTAVASTGRLPVILTPKGVRSAFLPPLAVAFNGKMVLEGASPLVDKQGKGIVDTRVCLSDDATIPFRPTSRPCDDEGVPARKTPLVKDGAVEGFLYDLQTAGRAGVVTTGSASRGRGTLPAPSLSAFVLEPGEATFDDMLRDVKQGLVVETLIGAGQGNILGGDFSGNVLLGYKVENGEIVGRVKDTMIAGNVYQAMNTLAAIENEAVWVGSPIKTPALYLSDISVACQA